MGLAGPFELVRAALEATTALGKQQAIEQVWRSRFANYGVDANNFWQADNGSRQFGLREATDYVPGIPTDLNLVHPKDLRQRKLGSVEGRAVFLHAIAHIEFNAINLALDAIYRYTGLPSAYYDDWLKVAREEAQHHLMIASRLEVLGYVYGDFPGHDGLWDIASRTKNNFASRMAMVPCVFEARGLDVTPGMIAKLEALGDSTSAGILQLILDDEVGHVAIGVRWFCYACKHLELDPVDHFSSLLDVFLPGKIFGPFNRPMRLAAGFTNDWIARLEAMNVSRRLPSGS